MVYFFRGVCLVYSCLFLFLGYSVPSALASDQGQTINCDPVDLDINGLDESQEDSPGAVIFLDRSGGATLDAYVGSDSTGQVQLSGSLPKGVTLRDASGNMVSLPKTWTATANGNNSRSFTLAATVPFDVTTLTLKLGDLSDSVKVKAQCTSCGGQTGCPSESQATAQNSIQYRLTLGGTSEGGSAGYLEIYSHVPTAELCQPLGLTIQKHSIVDVIDSGSPLVIQQVIAPNVRVDIASVTSTGYVMVLSKHDGSGWTEFRWVTVSKVSDSPYRLRFSESGDRSYQWQFEYDETDSAWKLAEGVDVSSPSRIEQASWQQVDATHRIKRIKHFSADGATVLSQTVQYYELFGWNEEMVKEEQIQGFDAGNPVVGRWTSWSYYTDAADPHNYGKVKLIQRENGFWQWMEYGSDRAVNSTNDTDGLVYRLIEPLGNNAYNGTDITALAAQNVVTRSDRNYSIDLDGDSVMDRLLKETVTVAGQVQSVRYEAEYGELISFGTARFQDTLRVDCLTTDPESEYNNSVGAFLQAVRTSPTHLGHRATLTRRWAEKDASQTDQTYANEVYRESGSDGSVTITVRDGLTTTTASGYSSVVNPMSLDDIQYGQKTVRSVDDAGNTISTTTYVRSGGASWLPQSFVARNSTDAFGRATSTAYYFFQDGNGGTVPMYTTEASYNCCHVLSSTDRASLTRNYTYTATGQVETSTGPDQVVHYSNYDPLGRVIESKRGPAGGTMTTVETTSYDLLGRVTVRGDGNVNKTFYAYRPIKTDGTGAASEASDTSWWLESRVYPHSSSCGPVQVTWTDSHGRVVRRWTASSSATWNGSDNGSAPSGSESLTQLSRTTYEYDWRGNVTAERQYYNLTGLALNQTGDETPDAGPNYYVQTTHEYDALGREWKTTAANGDVTVRVYDHGDRVRQIWQGTDGGTLTGVTAATVNPSSWTNAGNLVKTAHLYYDSTGNDEGTLLGYVTCQKSLKPLSTLSDLDADYTSVDMTDGYESVGGQYVRVVWTKPAASDAAWTKQVYDLEGRVAETYSHANGHPTDSLLAKSTNEYDASSGRLMSTRVYEVTGGTATANYLQTVYGYDQAGRQFRVEQAGHHGIRKTLYDNVGRAEATLLCASIGSVPETFDSDPFSTSDDVVMEETVYGYDTAGNVIQETRYQRQADASATTGRLSSGTFSTEEVRISYTARWYDHANRLTDVAEYGVPSSP